ncbi:CBS domain-containing protein [Sorangium sp. So ce1389]|uniref:CBS domain-containing protein n=1 Tax=Sorangium sp. So ce1389 TaxID=3133336 RepID=UPI003F5E51BA
MGEQDVSEQANEEQLQAFMRALLDDVDALERLLQEDRIESGVRRIGAEQEMFLVDRALRPAPLALEVLERAADGRLTTELARFNLEANLCPLPFGGDCLRRLEAELSDVVGRAAEAARAVGAEVLLAGILPTLRAGDLRLENLTPSPRYHELNRTLLQLRQGDFRVSIHGLDELEMTHDNILLESCNTSFQVHLQVGAREFAPLYNLAQAVTAPVLAAAVNSPLLLGQRLWQETRIALFESSIDTRPSARESRQHRPRVHFGDGWVQGGALELFREDIARFRVIMTAETGEPPAAVLARGEVPDLKALRVHNGTIYRWNRPCYGVVDGVAHLRIESRALPAGPTVLDEVANAAFFFGLMSGLAAEHPRVDLEMSFEDAKANFFAAARHGLKAQLTWFGGQSLAAPELILSRLLPAARAGLSAAGIDAADIDRYLGVIEERVRRGQTGAQWALGSLAAMAGQGTSEVQHRALCAAMLARQHEEARGGGSGCPVHTWEPAALEVDRDLLRDSYRTVGQFMSTDLFTVRPTDIVDFAASVMDWRHVRHVPVEDDQGRLVGVVSHRALLRLVARGAAAANGSAPPTVASIMRPDPVTITPETPTLDAMRIMREQRVGCLPVVAGERLVGIVTERDLLDVSARLLESFLREA